MRAIDADKLKEVLEKNFGHTGGASVLAQLIDAQDTIQPSALGTNLAEVGTDCISRQAAIDALMKRDKELRNINWYDKPFAEGECKGIDYALEIVNALPSVQPTQPNASNALKTLDCIDRQAAIDAVYYAHGTGMALKAIKQLPSAQPEIIRCKDCIYYDPPHVENNGVRYEYDEMPADAFDALGTGLVNAEYGINIGGRCCVDYYCKNYSDDKRVFVSEDNYCGRAERRTDEE